jgi:hypothetical protein
MQQNAKIHDSLFINYLFIITPPAHRSKCIHVLQPRGAMALNGTTMHHFNITARGTDKNQPTFKAE